MPITHLQLEIEIAMRISAFLRIIIVYDCAQHPLYYKQNLHRVLNVTIICGEQLNEKKKCFFFY